MPRNARLRLAQNVGEVGDRQFGFGQQRQDAQARFLARGFQRGVQVLESDAGFQPCAAYKDIFISGQASDRDDMTKRRRTLRTPQNRATDYLMTDDTGIRPGEQVAIALPEKFDAGTLLHRPHPNAVGAARRLPEKQPRIRRGLHHRGRPALRRRAEGRRDLDRIFSFSTGWIRRAAISCCRRRATTMPSAAHLRCARRCGQIRSPPVS